MSTSYTNLGGQGNRTGWMRVTSTMGISGNPLILVNGAIDNAFFWSGSVAGFYLRFDFGGSLAYGAQTAVIDEATWFQSDASAEGTWQWQGSNDGTTWTSIGSSFSLGGVSSPQVLSTLNGNTTAYRYYQMLGVSGTGSSSPWLQEIQFKISGVVVPNVYANNAAPFVDAGKGTKHQIVIAALPNFSPAHYNPVPVAAALKGGPTGTAYSETINAQGGTSPYTFAVTSGALPTGTTLNSSSGVISGTPSAASTFSFTITVTDSLGFTGSQAFQIVIAAPSGGGGGSFTFLG